MSTLAELIASEDDLVQEAGLALPHQFSNCTYTLGPVRQAVYLCLTCSNSRAGICSACSIACHTDHEQIELFPKRNFRCDCPTVTLSHCCTLHGTLEGENTNEYGKNFRGAFCRCGRSYDAKTERETMIQCLACEDWFHESCLNLRERPSTRASTPVEVSHPASATEDADRDDDVASEASSSGLPPPLISGSDYESFMCGACVSGIDIVKHWAGTKGLLMVIRDRPADRWKVHGDSVTSQDDQVDFGGDVASCTGSTAAGNKRPPSASGTHVTSCTGSTAAGTKRHLSPSGTEVPNAKRLRASLSHCLAPRHDPIAQNVLTLCNSTNRDTSLGCGDVFLTEGWRERWCRCSSCLSSLGAYPYLLEEEETYEPPEDPDSGLSLEELGMRALYNLPRDRAIDGIHAFNALRDDLLKYLRPFARDGKVVNEADVRSFFDSLEQKDRKT